MYDLVVSSGTVVSTTGTGLADIGVDRGRIAALAAPGTLSGRRRLDASGLHVLPGLIDAHVHLRDPGLTHKEDFRSGTMAAAAGGVTMVMAIPNTKPPLLDVPSYQAAVQAGNDKAVVDFAILAGAQVAAPAAITDLAGTGALAFDMHDDPSQHANGPLIELFRQVQVSGLPLAFYHSDKPLLDHNRKELEALGAAPIERFAAGTTGMVEVLGMTRIITLAARFGVPAVLRAVTTREGLALIRFLKGLYPAARVAVETCVHYLFLTTADLARLGPQAQMMPPLRPDDDVAALWQAVHDGTLTYIGTDHAPHAPAEKAGKDLATAPTGIIGLETLLPLLLNARAQGRLALEDIVRLCCANPARTYGIYPRKGAIAIGADADLVLVDLAERWTLSADRFYSRGDKGPFDGWAITGRPRATLVRGQIAMEQGVVNPDVRGRYITPAYVRDGETA